MTTIVSTYRNTLEYNEFRKKTGGLVMSFKIAFIGAGSLVFARTLFTDIMSVPELRTAEIAFTP